MIKNNNFIILKKTYNIYIMFFIFYQKKLNFIYYIKIRMERLPKEIIKNICSKLDVISLLRLLETNKYLYFLINQDIILWNKKNLYINLLKTTINNLETFYNQYNIKKCLFLTKTKLSNIAIYNIISDFYLELGYDKKELDKYYEFDTYIRFNKKLESMEDHEITNKYNYSAIIMEEDVIQKIQTLNSHEGVYNDIVRFINSDLMENRKILLNKQIDFIINIYSLLNMISKNDKWNDINYKINYVKSKIPKRILYLDIKWNLNGISISNINTPFYISHMKGYQLEAWKKLNSEDRSDRIHRNETYCSIMVTETLKYGRYIFNENMDINLTNLENHSCKIASIIELATKCKGPVYVFSYDPENIGSRALCKVLESIGYKEFSGDNIEPYKSYIDVNMQSNNEDVVNLIDIFNKKENNDGRHIKFIICDENITTNYIRYKNLRNLKQIHILSPLHNLSETNKIIEYSVGLHNKYVDVFLHVGVCENINILPDNNDDLRKISIDLYSYKN